MILKTVKICKALILLAIFTSVPVIAQTSSGKSQEVDERDGVPVLVKHLPDWEAHRSAALFTNKPGELQTALGSRPILDQIDFTAGTEAVTAPYDAGKLLIVEYTSPQTSTEADAKFAEMVAGDPTTAYRRIGNYNAFVFDVSDTAAANALLDQVKYEKQIQWLGNNPFRISRERDFTVKIADIFFSTVIWIVLGMGIAIVLGLATGFAYFRYTDSRRANLGAYSDAGGMTRLNLDGFTPEIAPERLLKE